MTNKQLVEGGCAGCGVKLQTTANDKPGYIPDTALEREPAICQRCFRIKNYNDATTVTIDQDDFIKLLGGIANTESLVVHIVDMGEVDRVLCGVSLLYNQFLNITAL